MLVKCKREKNKAMSYKGELMLSFVEVHDGQRQYVIGGQAEIFF